MRKTGTDKKRLVRSHYSKIYGSNAVGRHACEQVAKNLKQIVTVTQCPPRTDYLPPYPGGVDCPRRVCPVRQSQSQSECR